LAKRRGRTFHFNFEGLDEYIDKVDKLGGKSDGMAKRALYEGVAVVGESIRQAIIALPYHPTKGISHAQKEGLLDGLGFSLMKHPKKGVWYVKIGFDGYNSVRTKKHPNGQPNAMIAAAVNSGTSRRAKTNFIYKAVNRAKQQSMSAMKVRFDADIENLMKEK
jgi:hypothetical protein